MADAPVASAERALIALQCWASFSRSASHPTFLQKAKSAESVKTWASEGDYDDYANYSASLLCFLLLWPKTMGSDVPSLSFIIFSEDVRQVRMCVLSNWGKEIQKSGKGQDNYRANIVEWLLSHLAAHASEQGASAAFFSLQTAWEVMREWVEQHNRDWGLTRSQCLEYMISHSGREALPKPMGHMPVLSTTTASSSSHISPAMRNIIGADFPFQREFNELVKSGVVEEWYKSMRADFELHGFFYIARAIPGASKNAQRQLYGAVCAQFKVWD